MKGEIIMTITSDGRVARGDGRPTTQQRLGWVAFGVEVIGAGAAGASSPGRTCGAPVGAYNYEHTRNCPIG